VSGGTRSTNSSSGWIERGVRFGFASKNASVTYSTGPLPSTLNSGVSFSSAISDGLPPRRILTRNRRLPAASASSGSQSKLTGTCSGGRLTSDGTDSRGALGSSRGPPPGVIARGPISASRSTC
jgi:hypothetical protein